MIEPHCCHLTVTISLCPLLCSLSCAVPSPLLSLFASHSAGIGLVSLLVFAGEVSAQNHNSTVDTPWVWVDLPDSIVTGNLALRPGQQSKSWNHDGWISYGQKENAEECKRTCNADKNCWAFTWHGGESSWSGFCYGRAPNTVRVLPAVFKNSNSGHFSGYKSFVGKSFPNFFYFDYQHGFKKHWTPQTSFEQFLEVNLCAGGFSSPTTKDQSIVKGMLILNLTSAATDFANPVMARTGAVNIGITFTVDMCSAAADYMIYLDLVAGSPSVVANYYTWFNGVDDWTSLCLIGSDPFGSIASGSATSGKRTGIIPAVEVDPDYYDD